jgi:ABC-type dipeptide/oligopeptide/nickel transport system permease subunit
MTSTIADSPASTFEVAPQIAPPEAPKKVKKPWGVMFWVACGWLVAVIASTTVANAVNWKKDADFTGAPVVNGCGWRSTVSWLPSRFPAISKEYERLNTIVTERQSAFDASQSETDKTALEKANGNLDPVKVCYDALKTKSDMELITPTTKFSHPLGLNFSGNDILVDLVRGAKNSLFIAGATIFLGFVIGGVTGMFAGYFRGKLDSVLSAIMNVLLSVPGLLFILLMIAVLSSRGGNGQAQGLTSSVYKVSLALGILSIPQIFRVVRGTTMQFAQREFVMAARAMGAKVPRILLGEILPNVAKPMMAFGLVAAGGVMVLEGALSFLGIGVGSGTDTTAWGKQIAAASQRQDLAAAPMVAFIPGLALFFTILSLNYIGDKARERLETKQGAL